MCRFIALGDLSDRTLARFKVSRSTPLHIVLLLTLRSLDVFWSVPACYISAHSTRFLYFFNLIRNFAEIIFGPDLMRYYSTINNNATIVTMVTTLPTLLDVCNDVSIIYTIPPSLCRKQTIYMTHSSPVLYHPPLPPSVLYQFLQYTKFALAAKKLDYWQNN